MAKIYTEKVQHSETSCQENVELVARSLQIIGMHGEQFGKLWDCIHQFVEAITQAANCRIATDFVIGRFGVCLGCHGALIDIAATMPANTWVENQASSGAASAWRIPPPPCSVLLRYIALSTEAITDARSWPWAGYEPRPMDTLKSIRFSLAHSLMPRRTRWATISPPASVVRGSTSRNSSPP